VDTAPQPSATRRPVDPAELPAGPPGAPGGGAPRAGEEPPARSRARLRPPPPTRVHAPLLLGLDPDGGEHPQGPEAPDDERLVGRCWGCGCGWRGSVRDIATRHFRPQVGDGGGLRRKRLARADRDARAELDAHLASTAAPAAPATEAAAALRDRTGEAGEGAQGRKLRRRRLTLPRTTPDGLSTPAAAPATATSTGAAPNLSHPPAAVPDNAPECPAPPAEPTAEPGTAPGLVELEAPQSGEGALAAAEPPAAGAPTPPARGAGEDALAAAATRAQQARGELHAAEAALEAAVAAAREDGASWRTIARATGVPHREAAARWGQDPAAASL
jgi:hypothetical protein